MKGKNLLPRLLYPARLSFRFEGEIKTFTDKQKRENSATLNILTTNTKGTSIDRKEQEKKERKKSSKNKSKVTNKMAITYISIITLNVSGLKAPVKRHRLAEWIQKQDPYICCLQETHFTSRDTYKLKVRGW